MSRRVRASNANRLTTGRVRVAVRQRLIGSDQGRNLCQARVVRRGRGEPGGIVAWARRRAPLATATNTRSLLDLGGFGATARGVCLQAFATLLRTSRCRAGEARGTTDRRRRKTDGD